MMEGDDVVALETSGLSAVCIDGKWVVGRRCTGRIKMVEEDFTAIVTSNRWDYLHMPRPIGNIEMEVLAIAPTLSQALDAATKIVKSESV